jgi:hypothetical protein
MDERRQLEVSDWQDEPRPLPITRAQVSRRPRIPARALGMIGTVLLHGLVVQTAVLGTSSRKVLSPTTQGLASTANAAGAESEMTLVVVEPIKATNSKESLFEEFISRGSVLKNMPIALISPDPTPVISLQRSSRATTQMLNRPLTAAIRQARRDCSESTRARFKRGSSGRGADRERR